MFAALADGLWQPVLRGNCSSSLSTLQCLPPASCPLGWRVGSTVLHSPAPSMGRSCDFLFPSWSHIPIHSCLHPEIIPILSYPSCLLNNLSKQRYQYLGFIPNMPSLPPDRVPEFHTMHQASFQIFCLYRAIRLAHGFFPLF